MGWRPGNGRGTSIVVSPGSSPFARVMLDLFRSSAACITPKIPAPLEISFPVFPSPPISQIFDIPVDCIPVDFTFGLCDNGVFKPLGAILGLWPRARTVSRRVQNPDSSPANGWRRCHVCLASYRHCHFWPPSVHSLVYAHVRRRYVMSPSYNRHYLSFLANFDCPDDILCGLALVRPIFLQPSSK